MTTKRDKLLRFGKTLLSKLYFSLKRFPETLLMCAATVTVLIILNHGKPGAGVESGELLQRLAATLALGIPLSLCLKVFLERVSNLKAALRGMTYIVAAAGLVLYHFYLLRDFGMISISRYIATSLALYLAFVFIPYFYRKQNHELYVIRIFISLAVTYLFAGVLFGGLAAMLATINYLFSANIPGDLYSDIWLIIGGIFAPAFFLADIPRDDRELSVKSYPKVIGILLSHIVMPLILAYCAILYVYFIRILVTRQWPEVMVSHLVLWYAIFSALVIFCAFPLRPSNQWIKTFISLFPKLILPLLGLMFVAMGIRVSAYGITENRYFVLAAGLWVTGAMLYLIISKRPRNVFLPASLALVSVLAVYGPWSSYSISIRSQNHRLEKIAAAHDMIRNGRIVKSDAVLPEESRAEISSIITYFDRYHGMEQLRALPAEFGTDEMETVFGFPLYEYTYPGRDKIYFSYMLDEEKAIWDIAGFNYYMQFTYRDTHYQENGFEVIYMPESNELEITLQDQPSYTRNVAAIAAKLHRGNAEKIERDILTKEEMTFVERQGDLRLLYIFRAIGGWEEKATGELVIEYLEFNLFIDLDEEGAP